MTHVQTETFNDGTTGTGDGIIAGIEFNKDGTKMYIVVHNGKVYQFSLGTPYDFSNITYDTGSGEDFGDGGDIEFNNDGSKMFTVGTGGADDIDEYSLTTPYDITTAGTPDDSLTVGSVVQGIRFNDDGTKMFLMPFSDGNIREIHLGTAFDISSQTNLADPPVLGFGVGGLSNSSANALSIEFNSDGTKLFVVDNNYNNSEPSQVDQYILTTGFDINTMSYDRSIDISENTSTPRSLIFTPAFSNIFQGEKYLLHYFLIYSF